MRMAAPLRQEARRHWWAASCKQGQALLYTSKKMANNSAKTFDRPLPIDAARRLVEDQDLGVGEQPFAEHDLLQVAGGKADGLLL
jgi:hypothetical protein